MPCCKPAQPSLKPPSRPTIASPALTYPIALLMAEIGDACDGPADAMAARVTSALRSPR